MRRIRAGGLVLAPLAAAVCYAIAPSDLSPEAQRLAAVLGLVVVLWITEAIPLAVTSVLGAALAVVLRVADATTAFAPFGHPILFLFLGSFLIARGMAIHGLDRRIALFVLSRRWVGDDPVRILAAFGAIAAFLSMWMSNTATAAMMLPVGVGVLATLDARTESGGRYETGLMLMIAYGCSVGGIATPVGTPPNLIAIGMFERIAGVEIGFLRWMIVGVPTAVLGYGIVLVVLRARYARGVPAATGALERIRLQSRSLGPLGAGERAALAAFAFAVVLWTAPGWIALALGRDHPLAVAVDASLPEAVGAILAATVLFAWPVGRAPLRFALSWNEAVHVDWGTILLFGGGLSLGGLAFRTGLAESLGEGIVAATGSLPPAAFALVALFVANGLTEFLSNTATANVLVPTFLAVSAASAAPSGAPALGAALGCSLAFCLPVATPPNAIVYGSGRVPLAEMIRIGVVLDVACGLAAWAVVLALAGRLGL